MKKHIPNFITSLNLTSGFISIIYALNGDIRTSAWLILAAMVFDFLDGFSARLLKAYSPVGRELDSLADVVSFGVAPAIISYLLIRDSFTGTYEPLLIMIIPAFMAVCAALRLAIFNLDETQATSFKGLPTPANALAVVSIVIADSYSGSSLTGFITSSPLTLIIIVIMLSVLMVTRIPLLSLKTTSIRFRGNEGRYLLITAVAAVIIIFGMAGAVMVIPIYIIVSLISLLFRKPLLKTR